MGRQKKERNIFERIAVGAALLLSLFAIMFTLTAEPQVQYVSSGEPYGLPELTGSAGSSGEVVLNLSGVQIPTEAQAIAYAAFLDHYEGSCQTIDEVSGEATPFSGRDCMLYAIGNFITDHVNAYVVENTAELAVNNVSVPTIVLTD